MKKIAFFLLLSMGLLRAAAQEARVALTTRTSVSFPMTPVKMGDSITVTHLQMAKDSSYLFSAVVIDMEASKGFTAEAIALAALDPTFWDQIETSYLGNLGEGYTRKNREVKTINGKQALYLEMAQNANKGVLEISALILMDGKFNVNIVVVSKNGKDPGKERFFNSVEIKE